MDDSHAYSRPPSPAEQLWRHLSALFGVDSLKRRYGLTPPPEWAACLGRLSAAQLRNGVEKLTRSGAPQLPSLPQFLAMCHEAREFEDSGLDPRLSAPAIDAWEHVANLHLLDHVRTCAGRGMYFDERSTRVLLEHKRTWAEDMRAEAGPDGVPIDRQKAVWAEVITAAMKRCEIHHPAPGTAPVQGAA